MVKMEIAFDVANIPGPDTGEVVSPEVVGRYISRARRPLLVVGSEILRDEFFIQIAIDMGKKGIPIAATGHSIRGFVERGYDGGEGGDGVSVRYYNLHELTNCLRDPNWRGLDGQGSYDVVIFFGIVYYYASQMLSCIKNFAIEPLIRTVSIDRYYHPHARMSFRNIPPNREEEYKALLKRVVNSINR